MKHIKRFIKLGIIQFESVIYFCFILSVSELPAEEGKFFPAKGFFPL